MMDPLNKNKYAVAAIVSTYNAEEFLAGRLENLISQSLFMSGALEIIIVDSASEQDERRIVDAFMQKHRHIHYLRTAARESVYAAWNRGIRLADARYVINANTDDRFTSQALEILQKALDGDPLIHAVYGDWLQTEIPNDSFESSGTKVRFEYPEFFAPLLLHGQITTHAAMLRRELFDLVGYFDDNLKVYGDREFMLRCAERGLMAKKVNETIGLYYKNTSGLEHGNPDLGQVEFEHILEDYLKPERFVKLFGIREIPDNTSLAGLYTDAGNGGNGFLRIDGRPASNQGTAGRLFAEALSHDRHHPAALNNLGILACGDGRTADGIRLLEQALTHASVLERKDISLNLKIARQSSSRPGEFIWLKTGAKEKEIEMVSNESSPEQSYYRIQQMENRQQMLAALQDLVNRHPEYAPAHNDLGVLHYSAGDKSMALTHYEQAVRLQPENITSAKNLADFYYVEQGRVEEALQLYVKVLEVQPQDVETLTICGHICVAQQRFEDAAAFYRRVLEFEPWNSDVRSNLNKLPQQTSPVDPESGKEEMSRRAQELSDSGDVDGAIRILQTLIDRDPSDALVHNDLGVLSYQKGLKEKALQHYEQAANLQPENITFQKNLADFYYVEQNRVEDALKIYVNVLEIQPRDVETLAICGHICTALQRFDDAEIFYRQVIEIEPWNSDVRENLTRLQKVNSAVVSEQSADQIYHRAQSLATEGDIDGAMGILVSLLDRFPDNSLAHNDLGVLYYRKGYKDKALQHYELAANLQPENITFKKNLADFYYVEQGRVQDALSIYVQILEQQPADIETLLITGRICDELERPEDALVFFQQVMEIEPWNEEARQRMMQKDITRKAV